MWISGMTGDRFDYGAARRASRHAIGFDEEHPFEAQDDIPQGKSFLKGAIIFRGLETHLFFLLR